MAERQPVLAGGLVTHRGGCHCGAIRFEVVAPPELELHECNCSICSLNGFLHLIVPRDRFRLIRGQDSLSEYRFNTGVARHLFCRTCGIKSFYVPRSNPEGYSVNFRCLDRENIRSFRVLPFDGQNWEASADQLVHLA